MIPVATHFQAQDDALALVQWLDGGLQCIGPEYTNQAPGRPWTLIVCVPVAHGPGADIPWATLEALRRAATFGGGELDERRMDDSAAVFSRFPTLLPPEAIDRFRRERAPSSQPASEALTQPVQDSLLDVPGAPRLQAGAAGARGCLGTSPAS